MSINKFNQANNQYNTKKEQAIKTSIIHLLTPKEIINDIEKKSSGQIYSFIQWNLNLSENNSIQDTYEKMKSELSLEFHMQYIGTWGTEELVVDSIDFKAIKDYVIQAKTMIPLNDYEKELLECYNKPQDEYDRTNILSMIYGYDMDEYDAINYIKTCKESHVEHMNYICHAKEDGYVDIKDYLIPTKYDGKYDTDINKMREDMFVLNGNKLEQNTDSKIWNRLEYIAYIVKDFNYHSDIQDLVPSKDCNEWTEYDYDRVFNVILKWI